MKTIYNSSYYFHPSPYSHSISVCPLTTSSHLIYFRHQIYYLLPLFIMAPLIGPHRPQDLHTIYARNFSLDIWPELIYSLTIFDGNNLQCCCVCLILLLLLIAQRFYMKSYNLFVIFYYFYPPLFTSSFAFTSLYFVLRLAWLSADAQLNDVQ